MMDLFFQNFKAPLCCLCGSGDTPTGEHKIKDSALRKEFGKVKIYLHQSDDFGGGYKTAQSTKSKHLKFKSRICKECNGAKTQAADREFDRLHDYILEEIDSSNDPANVWKLDRYKINSKDYINVFRYFAKILSCHLADANAPIPIRLASFAIGNSDQNYISLAVQVDPTYENIEKEYGNHQFAAHSGLIIRADKKSSRLQRFHSTLTIGKAQFVFYLELAEVEISSLAAFHCDFYDWCQEKVKEAALSPLSENKRIEIGLQESSKEESNS